MDNYSEHVDTIRHLLIRNLKSINCVFLYMKPNGIKALIQRRYWCQAVVVAQLEERSLPTSEIRGLNPETAKFYLPIVQ